MTHRVHRHMLRGDTRWEACLDSKRNLTTHNRHLDRLRALIDWFLPDGPLHLPRSELQRLRMAIGTSLFIGLLSILSLSAPMEHTGSGTLITLCTVALMVLNLLAPRWLGAVQLPGFTLCVWPLVAVTILSLTGLPDAMQFCVVFPLLAAFFADTWLVVVCMVIGMVEPLLIEGPLTNDLPPREVWLRTDLTLTTALVGGLTLLASRLRSQAERERDVAQAELMLALSERITRETAERAQEARRLQHQALRLDIGSALADPGPLPSCLQGCCDALVRHLGMAFARIALLAPDGGLEPGTSAGKLASKEGTGPAPPVGEPEGHLVTQARQPRVTNDLAGSSLVGDPEWARREGLVAFAGYPLLVGEHLVGVLLLFSAEPLPEDTLSVLSAVSDTIAQGIQRKRAEAALASRAEALARSNADLEQFAYVASHDLQEPLRMVASYAQLLARRYKGRLDADADEFIAFMVDGIGRMRQLITSLLDYSRVDTGERRLAPVDAGRVLARTLASVAASIEESGAVVTHDALPAVQADEGQLGQLLQNLVGNAIKFRRPDEPPRVHISARRLEDAWELSVRDNGIGIEPQYFERIFVLFHRLHSRAEYPGTGIGLALCKKIVERHGGRIRVESAPGQGTTFFFTLPPAATNTAEGGRTGD